MSSLKTAAALAWMASLPLATDACANGEATIERWVREALEQHPQGTSARWDVQSSLSQSIGASAWMAPTAQTQYRSDGEISLTLSQMIPGPGKTDGLQEVKKSQLEMAQSDSAERMRQIELSVREAAWMEWMAWRKVEILRQQETLSTDAAQAAQRLQAQGMATPTESWLSKARSRQARSQREEGLAEAKSATAMRESWSGAGEPPLEAAPPRAPDWDDSALLRSVEQRPDIRSMEQDAAMQEAMSRSMRSNLRPDFMVGAMAMRMTNGMPGWGAMAGMTLPFVPWARSMAQNGASAEQAKARSIQARREAMKRMARAEILGHAQKARAAWAAWAELDSAIGPGQDRALADARSRYAQGREMFSMVLSMDDMVRMVRMEAVMRRGEYELERARLLAAAGIGQNGRDGGK
jgi:outer membrane protein TolC